MPGMDSPSPEGIDQRPVCSVGTTSQCCLKGKVCSLPTKLVNSGKHNTTRGQSDAFRLKGRQSLGDHIGVHELHHTERTFKEIRGCRLLSGAIWTGKHNDDRMFAAHASASR